MAWGAGPWCHPRPWDPPQGCGAWGGRGGQRDGGVGCCREDTMAHLSGHLKTPKWPRKNLLGPSGSLGRALGFHIVNPQCHWPSQEARKSLPLPRKRLCGCHSPEAALGRRRRRLARPGGETEAAMPQLDTLEVLEHRLAGGRGDGQSSFPIPFSHTMRN